MPGSVVPENRRLAISHVERRARLTRMRLHSYAASANCLKARVLLGLLDIGYELVEVDIFAGATLTDGFARLNPLRETPVLELDDGACVTQSNAILSYLAEGTPFAGATRLERGEVLAWLNVEQERVMPGIGGVRFRLITGRASAEELEPKRRIGRGILDVLDAHLAERRWLVGSEPTIADISIWAYGHLAADAGLDLASWPAVVAWCRRLESLRGFRDDLAPYPGNARPGAGRSIYD